MPSISISNVFFPWKTNSSINSKKVDVPGNVTTIFLYSSFLRITKLYWYKNWYITFLISTILNIFLAKADLLKCKSSLILLDISDLL